MRLFSITDLFRQAARGLAIVALAAGVWVAGGWLTEAAGPSPPAGAAPARLTCKPAEVTLDAVAAPAASLPVCGFRLVARDAGPQLAVMEPAVMLASLEPGEEVAVALPVQCAAGPSSVSADVALVEGNAAEVCLSLGEQAQTERLQPGRPLRLDAAGAGGSVKIVMRMKAGPGTAGAAIRWSALRLTAAGRAVDVPVTLPATHLGSGPPAVLPPLRPAIQRELVEWDWRMQDGIGTPREPSTYAEAIGQTLRRGERLLADLQAAGVPLDAEAARWRSLSARWQALSAAADPAAWEALWREVHATRRRIALSNPLAQVPRLAFVKHVPATFSHQLTQYQANCARPGGGVFVLYWDWEKGDSPHLPERPEGCFAQMGTVPFFRPGTSGTCRQLADTLPPGSYQHLDVSWDGQRLLLAYCRAETALADREEHLERHFHLYEVRADGSGLRRLTDGPYDDFAPRYLPGGKIVFVSTRRGGYHRCGRGPCNVYTLALCDADGGDPHTISFHETHEWDPAVLDDGRIVFTRWDYVDRDAVHYQQLWSVRPDGCDVRIFYGNYTTNPVGVWEARPVPGSPRVMATAAAHHAMTAGSIILLDVTRGLDGLQPIARLTPDAQFPESEAKLAGWGGSAAATREERRWPGHCYRSPYPLSEKYFFASYSFDTLLGEPLQNPANMFGLYLVDAFGNKELLYRDLNHCSLWAMPLAARPAPPQVPSLAEPSGKPEGTFLLRDVYQAWPALPPGTIRRLRITQVLPKTTPHINTPTVGIPNASPGRQVLGTVPVEADGSAYFRAPARIALAFQALDGLSQAVQTMRSLTYLQPGEVSSCVGCHERRTTAPPPGPMPLALGREPSAIQPGPDGSKPFSYPILVQPLLDRKCVSCHSPQRPEGKVVLTGQPQGAYTASYNALAPRVPYSAWGGGIDAGSPTIPDRLGARGSRLMAILLAGHQGVVLAPDEIERLATWMDTNVLFYGTFDPADQRRQQRGERIRGPAQE
jgi:cytochrome c553